MARHSAAVRWPEMIRHMRDVRRHDDKVRARVMNGLEYRMFKVDRRVMRKRSMAGCFDPVFLTFSGCESRQLFPKLVRRVGKGAWGI